VAALVFAYTAERSTSDKTKDIDFDPDHDSISYTSNYQSYTYRAQGEYDGTRWGLGPRLRGRLAWRMGQGVTVRALEEVVFLPQYSTDYRTTSSSRSTLTMLSGAGATADSVIQSETGDQTIYSITNISAVGAEIKALGARWYYNYYYLHQATTLDDGVLRRNNDRLQTRYTNRVTLPVGLEYRVREKYAFRLGVTSSFTFYGSAQESELYGRSTASTVQVSSTATNIYDSENTTSYAYGFGCRLRDNMQLDMTGTTNLLDISNLYLSLLLTY
jgi:hypothetical protein